MTTLKLYNPTSLQWEVVAAGGPGPAGGVSNVQNVTGMWSGTQAAYDAIGTKTPTVLYIIVP
jgi:hypothetical protein